MSRDCRVCGSPITEGFAFCSRCGASAEAAVSSGDPLLDKLGMLFGSELRFERVLGRGAMGAVYLALDAALQRRVAVKTLLSEKEDEPEAIQRLLREARTVASLSHAHVVSVYSVRSSEHVTAIVMQYVQGRALDVILRESPTLSLPVVGQIVHQVAMGLRHAHESGVVHRDVKPANVLVEHTGRALVSDFGLARYDGATALTGTGVVPGTIAYMSPEQCTGNTATAASDQYALGVLAFELLASRRPFLGSLPEVVRGHVSVPPPMNALRAGTPSAIAASVARMLSKSPTERYANLREVEALFGQLVDDAHETTAIIASISRVATPSTSPPPAPRSPTTSVLEVTTVAPPRRWTRAIGAAVGAIGVVALAVVGARAWENRRSEATAAAEPSVRTETAPPTASTPVPSSGATAQDVRRNAGTPPSDRAPTIGASPPPDSGRADTPVVAARRDSAQLNAPVVGTAAVTAPKVETAPLPPVGPPLPPVRVASVSDARTVTLEFVRLLNMRITRDIQKLGTIRGDTVLRAELLRLTRDADFAAGIERNASSPEISGDVFVTECTLAIQSKSGDRTMVAELQAEYRDGGWHLSAFRLERSSTPAPIPS